MATSKTTSRIILLKNLKHQAIQCGIASEKAVGLSVATYNAISLYLEYKEQAVYNYRWCSVTSTPLWTKTKTVVYGEYYQQQKSQRRRIKRIHPKNKVGRKEKNAIGLLVSLVASAFCAASDRVVTLNQEGMRKSMFHNYIEHVLGLLGVFNVRYWISRHFKERKSRSMNF